MILYELLGGESSDIYQELEMANGLRHYDFLLSAVHISLKVNKAFLSTSVIKALNFHAITCLHTNAGEFRPCEVTVGQEPNIHFPPAHFRVQALMDDLINTVNRGWETTETIFLSAYVLWRLNYIHPFINGNGRTARAASYFVLCLKSGGLLPGKTILPELLRVERARYVDALKMADASMQSGTLDLSALHSLMSELLQRQLASVENATTDRPSAPETSAPIEQQKTPVSGN